MISQYNGNFEYNRNSIQESAPSATGVYFCVHFEQQLVIADYIGKATGVGVSIKSRLLDHINSQHWPEVTHFGYILCTLPSEADRLEVSEIVRCGPKYNKRLG